ncbi:Mediator of RNA polymerase II transcription subunit 12 [Hypsizygus marmoreus]|uniref:Mediator of RNA polymerase II transcription subunit 12 n=1 Tax=Hypsizygus marmoreus TaxID=39966 RepID=A0A369JX96_HYPMA|nr:Mediator of RNA polymerase II transcription subunit 12 [Hypsizygus marmoreus]
MLGRKDDKSPQALPLYKSHPPDWLPKVHASADLGYPGFFPPRAGQDEDVLSEANVKNGFVLGHQVSAETFSAQSIINEDLRSDATISSLEALMNAVFIRRADSIPPVPSSTFRIPSRVTLNDAKRQAWFADLANPGVPLHKLGKSVPHGAKGHDLLDLLQSNNIAIPRAVWFLRVFGANETAGLRNKPSYNPVQYSVDWANVVTSYMKKQLADIALPSAPRPGLNIKQTFKGVLADSDTRERWISRFTYCLKLLRTFYSEGLVDNRTFLIWIVQQMGICNLAQTGFITRLADEYLDGIIGSRPLTRPFIDASLSKLSEIHTSSAQEFLCDTQRLLKTLLKRLCIASPDSFISPRMWKAYSSLLEEILRENVMDQSAYLHIEQHSRNVSQALHDHFTDIQRRNEALLFQRIPIESSTRLGSAVSDVKLLNSISSTTDMNTMVFFPQLTDDKTRFTEKLDMLLTWCVTPLQYGDHRPFAAVTLIRNWRTLAGDRANRRDFSPPDEFLQDRLFDWLDSSESAGEPENIRAVALLFGKLVKHELFSYASYIQRLIARGEQGLSFTSDTESRHRNFLRWIPLFQSTSSLISQRKAALYGVRARETPEDINEREIRREIRSVLPDVFGGESHIPVSSTSMLLSTCKTLVSSTRFEQVRTFRQWLLPILQKHIAGQGTAITSPMLLTTYSISVELMSHAKCFHTILDLTLSLLEHSITIDLLIAVIDTLHRFAVIWASMNAMGQIIFALDTAHQSWKARGIQSRPLLSLLLEFDNGRYLSMASRDRITTDITAFISALQPPTDIPDSVPDVLPEILLLAGDPDVDAPTLLANSLWIKYRKSSDWAWKVWDNTVASLRQIPLMTSDTSGRRACALRYGAFLWHVDQHLAMGLDNEVLQWFVGPGKNEVAALSSDAWEVLIVVMLYMSIHGALKTTTILRGLVYPAWLQAANIATVQPGPGIETLLRSANGLCRRLLLLEDINDDNLPPENIFELQCIRTRRQDVYCMPHFPFLASSIPLLICVENNEHVPEDLRADSTLLRQMICQNRDFRQGAYRNLDAIREAFEYSLQQLEQPAGPLGKHIVAGLRMILCDISDDIELSDWPSSTCLLGPWKIAATMVQLQLILKQMGQGLMQNANDRATNANLDKLILMLFHHSMTTEEAFYVGEMARGVDSVVAGKFISNGLKSIKDMMLQESSSSADVTLTPECFRRSSDLLRVLTYVAEPLREKPGTLPILEHAIQDDLLDILYSKIVSLESSTTETATPPHLMTSKEIVLLLRLLQFELGFRSTWTSKTKEINDKLACSLFKLAQFYGASENLDPIIYPLIIDTLYYIYDEIPTDPKATYDPFRNYPDIPISDLPFNLPSEYRKQLASLLPLLPVTATVLNLVNSHRDAEGKIVVGTSVVNRPWEWIENLGDPAIIDPKDDQRERETEKSRMKYQVKNSGSLSLETFGARITGDGVLRDSGQELDSRTEQNLRCFEDGLSAENIFKRDWRETRVELEDDLGSSGAGPKGEIFHDGGGTSFRSGVSRLEKRPTQRASPTSSVVSRISARGSAWQSPGQRPNSRQSNSTISDTIDVDSVTTGSSARRLPASKRKATSIAISDDEIEIIEGPVPVRPNAAKKVKAKAPAKARAKKK